MPPGSVSCIGPQILHHWVTRELGFIYSSVYMLGLPGSSLVKILPAKQETRVQPLG